MGGPAVECWGGLFFFLHSLMGKKKFLQGPRPPQATMWLRACFPLIFSSSLSRTWEKIVSIPIVNRQLSIRNCIRRCFKRVSIYKLSFFYSFSSLLFIFFHFKSFSSSIIFLVYIELLFFSCSVLIEFSSSYSSRLPVYFHCLP